MEQLWTPPMVAEHLGCTIDDVAKLVRMRRIRHIRLSRAMIRFHGSDIEGKTLSDFLPANAALNDGVEETPMAMRILALIGPRDHVPADSRVYFIRNDKFVKVGFSRDVASRFATFQENAPQFLELIGTIRGDLRTERDIHHVMRAERVRGEWFKHTSRVAQAVRAVCKWG